MRIHRNYISKLFFTTILFITVTALLSTQLWADNKYTKTKHPVVFVHGFLGFNNLGPVDMYYGIIDPLIADGTTVYKANISSVNSSEVRGEQVIEYLEELKAIHGHEQFNLIGHSQGGLDIRYVAAVRPDLTASITAVGSSISGSEFLDNINNAIKDDPFAKAIVVNAFNIAGSLIELLTNEHSPQDAIAILGTHSTEGGAEFNQKFPQALPRSWCGKDGDKIVNDVRYYSLTGNKIKTNIFDLVDIPLAIVGAGISEDSDGLITRCGTHLGKVLKDNYSWNHVDEVNNLFGLIGWGAAYPPAVYRTHVNRLKKIGL